MRTLAELAREALLVQDACNLSGVVHGFSRAMTDLREHLEAEGGFSTEKLNRHPICVLWADKVVHLTQQYNDENVGEAYAECRKLADSGPPKMVTVREGLAHMKKP